MAQQPQRCLCAKPLKAAAGPAELRAATARACQGFSSSLLTVPDPLAGKEMRRLQAESPSAPSNGPALGKMGSAVSNQGRGWWNFSKERGEI